MCAMVVAEITTKYAKYELVNGCMSLDIFTFYCDCLYSFSTILNYSRSFTVPTHNKLLLGCVSLAMSLIQQQLTFLSSCSTARYWCSTPTMTDTSTANCPCCNPVLSTWYCRADCKCRTCIHILPYHWYSKAGHLISSNGPSYFNHFIFQ